MVFFTKGGDGSGKAFILGHPLGEASLPGIAEGLGEEVAGFIRIPEATARTLEAADLVVGADSGPAHLAAAVGTPVVVLFSGTNNPQQWQSTGRQVAVVRESVECSPCHRERCPRANHPCMTRLKPQQVMVEVEKLLSKMRIHRPHSLAFAGTETLETPRRIIPEEPAVDRTNPTD